MYKVGRKEYAIHADAVKAAKSASRIFPVHLKTANGGAWYWRGQYCGMRFLDIIH